MENSKLVKIILIVLIGIMIASIGTSVLATDSTTNGTYDDLASVLGNNTSSNNATTNNAVANNATTNNAISNNATSNGTLNTSALRNNATPVNNAVGNTTLPKTGISDSVPVVVLIVIFGISAVYAYNKIKDYKNL